MPEAIVDDFKLAMRRQAASVAIITSGWNGEWIGMTATAVSTVSAEPPSLVIGVNQRASLHDMIGASGRFCVNLLSPIHAGLIQAFSGKAKGRDRFAFGQWEGDVDSAPYLKDALASLLCMVDARMSYATHTLFVGRVEAIRLAQTTTPLIWQNAAPATVQPLLDLMDAERGGTVPVR